MAQGPQALPIAPSLALVTPLDPPSSQTDQTEPPLVAAARCRAVPHTPIWFMRQAGRSLPEYRQRKGSVPILEALKDPELTAELTLQPVRRLGVDAAILYSDIMAPVAATGFGVEIKAGVGPVVAHPFRSAADLDRLRVPEPDDHPWLADAIRLIVAESPVPLIGFAGAPFTVASYLIEGGPSREQVRTRALMRAQPQLWAALMDRLAEVTIATLRQQVEAGVAAVQLFDSWVGTLSPWMYEEAVAPATRRIFTAVAELGVPAIHFGVGTGELLTQMGAVGADVVGVDWRVNLRDAHQRVGPGKALQGNLDPTVLLAGWEPTARSVDLILEQALDLPGHIFNLGHGVMPDVNPDVLRRVVDRVHERTAH